MTVVHVSDSSFELEVLKSVKPVIVDFWAVWCMPCQMMGPVFEEVSALLPGAKFVKVNVDDCPDVSMKYGIDGIPCLIVFKAGKEVGRLVGYREKDALKLNIEQLLNSKK